MNKFRNGKVNPVFLILGIIIIGSLIITIINQKQQSDNLKVYNHQDDMSIVDTATDGNASVETFTIAYDDAGFSLGIPNGWEKVKKNGYDNYIHTPSATSVGIEILPYNSSVNNDDESGLSAEITNNGYGFVSFEKKSTSSYEVIYQEQKEYLYDYIDEVIWSKDNIIKLHFIVRDDNFSKMSNYLDTIYNSFTWHKDANTIQDNVMLIYLEYGDFEFAVPTDWNVGTENNTIYATNQDNSAQMVLTITENPSTSLSDVSSYDITSMIQPSRNNGFMLQSMENDVTYAKAIAQYYNNEGVNMECRVYYHTNGAFLYTFEYDYVSGTLDNEYTDILDSYYREFWLEHNKDMLEATSSDATSTDANTD